MSVVIKKLKPEDSKSAKKLFLIFQTDDKVKVPTFASHEYLKNLLARDDFHVVAAFAKDEIIGGLTAYELPKYKSEKVEMFLYELVVEKSHRRKGVATKLLKFINKICAEKGISEMFLATEIDNESARNLYEKTGGELEESAIYTYTI